MGAVEHWESWLRTAIREHWLPLLILIPAINVAVGVWPHQSAFLFVLVVPVVAAIVGYVLRPRHVWLVWFGGVVIVWISMAAWGRFNDPEDETVTSLMLEALIEVAVGVALPLWLGRLLRNWTSAGETFTSRHDGPGARPPAVS
jgi:hypothetical protein